MGAGVDIKCSKCRHKIFKEGGQVSSVNPPTCKVIVKNIWKEKIKKDFCFDKTPNTMFGRRNICIKITKNSGLWQKSVSLQKERSGTKCPWKKCRKHLQSGKQCKKCSFIRGSTEATVGVCHSVNSQENTCGAVLS